MRPLAATRDIVSSSISIVDDRSLGCNTTEDVGDESRSLGMNLGIRANDLRSYKLLLLLREILFGEDLAY
jgi:hypothetical protein